MWGIFTNGCMLCIEVVQSIGVPLDAEFRELRLQEVNKRSCTIDRGLGVLPRPPATSHQPRHVAARRWRYSCRSAHHKSAIGRTAFSQQWLQWQLLTLWDIRRYARDRFLEVSQPSKDVKGKPSVLNRWSVLMLRDGLSVPDRQR